MVTNQSIYIFPYRQTYSFFISFSTTTTIINKEKEKPYNLSSKVTPQQKIKKTKINKFYFHTCTYLYIYESIYTCYIYAYFINVFKIMGII